MKSKKDSSPDKSGSEQILQKLSTLEELLKKKDDKPLTFKEACAYLCYAPSYLYKLTYRKVIPHYKPTGKMIFFSKNELDNWIFESGKREGHTPSGDCRTPLSRGESDKDPNQIEMELGMEDEKRKIAEKEIVIEFPLKSRRGK